MASSVSARIPLTSSSPPRSRRAPSHLPRHPTVPRSCDRPSGNAGSGPLPGSMHSGRPKEMTMLAMRQEWPLDVTELKPALELMLAIARADMGILMLHDDGDGALYPVLG